MAQWDHGYVTDVVYTSNFYRETTPTWMATTALMLGHRPPSLSAPFRYADLGCANGFTALTVAATSPQADVWGFDFNPAHIEAARELAARAGLTNVHFVETAFAELAALPPDALPEFDFMVSHGVASWVSPANRRQMLDVIRQRLRPGGLAYVSYNVSAGWSSMVPLRALMRLLAQRSPSSTDDAAIEALDTIDGLKSAGALFFPTNPMIEARLAEFRRQDSRYLAHEFLNQDWHPLTFAEIEAEMAECKCSYIGSATLTENIDAASVPQGLVQTLSETRDLVLRETLRDFATSQGFRRDLYRRGVVPLASGEHSALLDSIVIAATDVVPPDPMRFDSAIGTITGRQEIYRPIYDRLRQGPTRVGELRSAAELSDRQQVELLQAISLMMAGGFAHPVLPNGDAAAVRQAARSLNRAMAAINAGGGDLPRVILPLLGTAAQVDVVEMLLLGALLGGTPAEAEALATELQAGLAQSGRTMQRDGAPIADPAEVRQKAIDLARQFLDKRVAVLRRLAVLDG